jgi:3',5'-cyclic AMP phosphodiesterase CpdA
MDRMTRAAAGLIASIALVASALARQAPVDASFFFLQFSDPQFGMFTADKDFAQETANFEFAIATANRLRPAFVVITGDLVNKAGDAAQIAEYQRIAAKLDRSIPLYNVAGNHDVENTPTPETVAAYTKVFGPDHYTFRYRSLVGIVLDSTIMSAPEKVPELYAEQDRWLKTELAKARGAGTAHIVLFQHHPWFLKDAAEPDGYYNIKLPRRSEHLALLHEFGVTYVFAGHYHNNSPARDGDLEMITSGPVGKPQGQGARSGIRVAIVRAGGIEHRFYEFSEIPNAISLSK